MMKHVFWVMLLISSSTESIYHRIAYYQSLLTMRDACRAQVKLQNHGEHDYAAQPNNIGSQCLQQTLNFKKNYDQIQTVVKDVYPQFSPRFSKATSGVIAAVVVLRELALIAEQHRYQNQQLKSISYEYMLQRYPDLTAHYYQILLMKSLVDMCQDGSLAEKIFAVLHIPSITVAGPYARYSKKQAKKLYKKCFDVSGKLMVIDDAACKNLHEKFYHSVSLSWQDVILNHHKYHKAAHLSDDVLYPQILKNDYNQQLLKVIQAAVDQDFEFLQKQSSMFLNSHGLMSALYSSVVKDLSQHEEVQNGAL